MIFSRDKKPTEPGWWWMIRARLFGVRTTAIDISPNGMFALTAIHYQGVMCVVKEVWTPVDGIEAGGQ